MKKILKPLFTLVFFTIIIAACQPQADVSAILGNEETQNEIYEAIVADHGYSQEMMAKMMEDDHTQMMMKGNGEMMSMMMSDNEDMKAMMKDNPEMMQGMMGNMMNMAESDSSMCANMISMMKDKPNMMGQMMDMMHKEGMMDKETMMKNKEMMGIDNH